MARERTIGRIFLVAITAAVFGTVSALADRASSAPGNVLIGCSAAGVAAVAVLKLIGSPRISALEPWASLVWFLVAAVLLVDGVLSFFNEAWADWTPGAWSLPLGLLVLAAGARAIPRAVWARPLERLETDAPALVSEGVWWGIAGFSVVTALIGLVLGDDLLRNLGAVGAVSALAIAIVVTIHHRRPETATEDP